MTSILILLLNLPAISFLKGNRKYFLIAIPLWGLLLFSFIGWRAFSDNTTKVGEALYWQSVTARSYGDHEQWTQLKTAERQRQMVNRTLADTLLFQTLITFILQLLGVKRTSARVYSWTSWAFGVLFVILLAFRMMVGIVPYGYVT